jgi:hypothetical protein
MNFSSNTFNQQFYQPNNIPVDMSGMDPKEILRNMTDAQLLELVKNNP